MRERGEMPRGLLAGLGRAWLQFDSKICCGASKVDWCRNEAVPPPLLPEAVGVLFCEVVPTAVGGVDVGNAEYNV